MALSHEILYFPRNSGLYLSTFDMKWVLRTDANHRSIIIFFTAPLFDFQIPTEIPLTTKMPHI
jgi:hypothetical protein